MVTCINKFFKKNKRSHKIIQKIAHIFQSVYITGKINPDRGVLKIFLKHSNYSDVQIPLCTVGTNLKNYISLKNAYFLIFYMSKINFKKSRIKKKYQIKFKKSSVILFFTGRFRVSRIRWKQSSPKYSFIYSILESLSNSNEILNSSSRSEDHTSFGNFFKIFQSC